MGSILSTYVATKILIAEPCVQECIKIVSQEIKGTSAVLMKEIELQHLRTRELNDTIYNMVTLGIIVYSASWLIKYLYGPYRCDNCHK